jgi:hypothetical protein
MALLSNFNLLRTAGQAQISTVLSTERRLEDALQKCCLCVCEVQKCDAQRNFGCVVLLSLTSCKKSAKSGLILAT